MNGNGPHGIKALAFFQRGTRGFRRRDILVASVQDPLAQRDADVAFTENVYLTKNATSALSDSRASAPRDSVNPMMKDTGR